MKYNYLILLLVFLVSCNNDQKEKNQDFIEDSKAEAFQAKSGKMTNQIVGKRFNSIPDLVSGITNLDEVLIFYFTGSDCYTCIVKGFDYIKDIKTKFPEKHVIVIDAHLGISLKQEPIEFNSLTYPDRERLLHKEMFYVHTPLFMRYSIENGAKSVYFVPTFEDRNKYQEFINNLN